MLDLKPLLANGKAPTRSVLYYGSDARIDGLHARHLADLPNFIVKEVPDTRHNTIATLLADEQFEGIFRKFLR